MSASSSAKRNHVLAALPEPVWHRWMPALEPVAKQAHPLDTSVAMPAVDPAAVPAQESAPAMRLAPDLPGGSASGGSTEVG